MNKKCNKCQVEVNNPRVSRSYYDIREYNLKSSLKSEEVNQFYCCEPCWYHKKESEKYLTKPYYQIWRIQIDEGGVVRKSQQLQHARTDLITIYKEMEEKGISNIDLKELEELQNLRETLKMWGPDAPINQQKKVRREELEKKYSGSQNPANNSEQSNSTTINRERERERERAMATPNLITYLGF